IQQTMIVELAGEIASTHDPHVLSSSSPDHGLVHRAHVSPHEANIGTRHYRQLAGGEDPGRQIVGPGLRMIGFWTNHVAQHPLVSSGAHRQRAYLPNETRIAGLG